MINEILLKPLFNVLLLFYSLIPGHDFGLAVILLTILIRLLLWPLIKKQLHHQKAMRDLAPEIAKVKQRAKGDRQKESVMMLELFKEKEINPFGSIGLAFLQFPILIALYFVIRRIVNPTDLTTYAYAFTQHLSPVKAIIANPSAFNPTFLGIVHMANPNLVLALIAGLVQFVQAKQLMPSNQAQAGPGANIGFTMNLVFPLLTVAIAAKLPSALALYWAASSFIAVIQQQRVLKGELAWMKRLVPRRRSQDAAK